MVMETVQIRLTKKLVEKLKGLVKEGFYPNKSEAVRDAVRRLIIEHELGELGEELNEGKELDKIEEHVKEMRRYCH
jgi:Arc/MetJ-type ribon-helix-helix transcriptional regulator